MRRGTARHERSNLSKKAAVCCLRPRRPRGSISGSPAHRWAEGRIERFTELAAEFARLKVDLIVAATTPAVIAAKQATSLIPIVIATADDPVGTGLVASLARPGGNVTGLSNQLSDTSPKRLELLREVVPGLRRLAILSNVGNPGAVLDMREFEAAVRMSGLETL